MRQKNNPMGGGKFGKIPTQQTSKINRTRKKKKTRASEDIKRNSPDRSSKTSNGSIRKPPNPTIT